MEENKVLDVENEELGQECECNDSEEIMGQIAVQEELKRIDIQDKPNSKVPKEIKNGKLYSEILEQGYAIGECFQLLLNYGIDYSNAVAISSNIMTGKTNFETEKVRFQNAEQQL